MKQNILLNITVIGFMFLLCNFNCQVMNAAQLQSPSFEIINHKLKLEPVDDQQIIVEENNFNQLDLFNVKSFISGPQRVAVVLARFLESPTKYTPAEIEEFYNWINAFWINASNGHISIDYDVYGWYDLDDTFEGYNNSGKWKKWAIAHTAIDKADNDCDFTQYDHVQVWLSNLTERCVSNVGKQTNRETNDGTINVALSIIFENPGKPYVDLLGSVTHELGHSFGLPHTHGGGSNGEKNYASFYSLMARSNPGALNGYHMKWGGVTNWYDENIQEVIVEPGQIMQGYIKPRYLETTLEPQYIIVRVSNLIYYRIEVIEKKSEDSLLKNNEGVYIYLVDENKKKSDQCTDMDSTPNSHVGYFDDLKDCLWNIGQIFVNATFNLNITILNKVNDMYEVRVENLGNGFPDVMIHPWGDPPGHPGPWESIDVWVDSPVNGYNNYKYKTPFGYPKGIGDDPWANHENRLYARIHNIGNGLAEDVTVYFYQKIPISAGDNGEWSFIGHKTIEYINAGHYVNVYIPWIPEIAIGKNDDGLMKLHGCIFVTIEILEGEIDVENNKCQENIAYFEITAEDSQQAKLPSSTYSPITTKVMVNNPYNKQMELFVDVINFTSQWIVQGDRLGEFTTFGPYESKEYEIVIIPGNEIRITDRFNGELIVCEEYIGVGSDDFMGDIHLQTVGGCSFSATVAYRSELDLKVAFRSNGIDIMGQLNFIEAVPSSKLPQTTSERIILLEIKNIDVDTTEYYTIEINSESKFSYSYLISIQGNYAIKAYYGGTEYITHCSSVTIRVDSINSSIWTSGKLFPGLEFYIAICILTFTTILIKIKQKNKGKRR